MMQRRHIAPVVAVMLVMVSLWIPSTVSGQGASSATGQAAGNVIQPPDVYALTMLFRQELDVLSSLMGTPSKQRSKIEVANAQPREVFFQALTLFRKTDRLCFEFTRDRQLMPRPPQEAIRPGHVWNVVQAAFERLTCVKEAMQIARKLPNPPRDATKTPTDVFKSIVHANRQLNDLLEHEFTPAEVFAQVHVANDYATQLLQALARFGDEKAPPTVQMPPYAPGKRPVDVYARLTTSFTVIEQIAQASDLKVLDFTPETDAAIVPSDVYDIASLVVSELRYFSRLMGFHIPPAPRRTARKLPSHVLQRVELLNAQLREIQSLVQQYPNWHTAQR